MRTIKTKTNTEEKLIKELKSLTSEVKNLKHLEFVKVMKKPRKYLFYSFLHGLMVGFGSVLGATVVVAIFVYLLAQISFIPIIGDLVESVLHEIRPSIENSIEQNNNNNYNNLPEVVTEGDDSFKTPVSAVVPESSSENPTTENDTENN
ncbi:MAG: DUF5665 domain-containing protein [Candidatus Gracilibacteria bacterium]|jgi:hypothetical protein|nr:DUF5665 domain-containing protein [Candidatus Gracilibacteria bacterium]